MDPLTKYEIRAAFINVEICFGVQCSRKELADRRACEIWNRFGPGPQSLVIVSYDRWHRQFLEREATPTGILALEYKERHPRSPGRSHFRAQSRPITPPILTKP